MKLFGDYFDFTKKERIAVISLIGIVILLYLLPQIISRFIHRQIPDYTLFKKEIAALQNQTDDSSSWKKLNVSKLSPEEYYSLKNQTAELFFFNPNTISSIEWEKLGLDKKVISHIEKYLATGAKFKSAEDLRKIYGISEDDYERLAPFISIPFDSINGFQQKLFSSHTVNQNIIVELNSADSVLLESMNGIGPYLAHSIIQFRNALGGFYSVNQLAEVKGMKPDNFEKLKSKFTVDVSLVKKININTINEMDLSKSPFLKYAQAKAIVAYRKAHGNFSSVEQLSAIEIIDAITIQKLKPYLVFQ